MAVPKEYFHDRVVLLLITINAFLAALGSILVLLNLDPGRNEGYIVQYRESLGISAFKTGQSTDLIAFIGLMGIVLAVNIIISMRIYHIHRQFAVTILGMGVFLLLIGIIVSNALLVLR